MTNKNDNNIKEKTNVKRKDPYDDINFIKRKSQIIDSKGNAVFDEDVEFPDFFNDNSVSIVSSKYLLNSGKHKETSIKHMVDRVSDGIGEAGKRLDYFKTEEEYNDFVYKLKLYQINQNFAFNSPVYFNMGVHEKPQCSACFILDIEDTMDSIFEVAKTEALIFKNGSGTGINMSSIRSAKEKISAGGNASGPVSFLKSADISAGVIKSGGTLRRSAKLVCLDIDHPDIEEFITCKKKEEEKLRILKSYGVDNNSDLSDHVFYQNTNISVRLSDEFMNKAEAKEEWWTKNVTNGEKCDQFAADNLLKDIAKLAWQTGDPGVQFSDAMNEWHTCPEGGEIKSTNPCVTGDTLVSVADGRGIVDFKTLVLDGKDVPVYCNNSDGELKIRYMRNPRVTGYNQEIYKVNFDDGNFVKVTGNHKFILNNGNVIEAKNLKNNDSIKSMTRNIRSLGKKISGNKSGYAWVSSCSYDTSEHRMMYEFYNSIKIKSDEVIHHKDYNSFNNSIENLELMKKKNHDKLHCHNMFGKNNPMVRAQTEWSEEKWKNYKNKMSKSVSADKNGMYLGIDNKEIRNHALNLTKKLGRKFTKKEWKNYTENINIPSFENMGIWRSKQLNGSISGLSKWCALELGFDSFEGITNFILEQYQQALSQGYNTNIKNVHGSNVVLIQKTCEKCNNNLITNYKYREISICGKCSRKEKLKSYKTTDSTKKKISLSSKIWSGTKEGRISKVNAAIISTKNKALICGSEILSIHNYINKNDWNGYKKCLKEKGIKKFIHSNIINKYWNNNWDKFIEDCRNYNHKVVSVELIGKEDVYNGTVDEFHNYYIIGEKSKNNKIRFVNTMNCGEFAFVQDSACNLASINLLRLFSKGKDGNVNFDIKKYKDIINTMVIAQDILVGCSSYPTKRITKNSHDYRPLGLGYSNLGSTLMWLGFPYGNNEGRTVAASLTALLTGYAYNASNKLAERMGSFEKYEENKSHVHRILNKHNDAASLLASGSNYKRITETLLKHVKDCWKNAEFLKPDSKIRNAQVTLLAPTGTTSFLMGCSTTGIEPEFLLVKEKSLAGSGGAIIKIVNDEVKQSLINLGYSENESERYISILKRDGHLENTELIPEHLAIFDTANIPNGGVRCIDYMAHIKMLAAVQPFLSGAISKTINMPENVSVDDVHDVYVTAWKMGLKGITVFREGSKAFSAFKREDTSKKKEELFFDTTDGQRPEMCKTCIPFRKKLPTTRTSINHKFSIAGVEGYLHCGLYNDGKLGEIFVRISKQGSTLSGIFDSFATMISINLQYGVPLKDIVRKLMNQRFEPAGFTGNPDIRTATSIVDYIGKFIGMKFLLESDQIQLGLKSKDNKEPEIVKQLETININSNLDGPACSNCGHIMVKKGSCYWCYNCSQNEGACS